MNSVANDTRSAVAAAQHRVGAGEIVGLVGDRARCATAGGKMPRRAAPHPAPLRGRVRGGRIGRTGLDQMQIAEAEPVERAHGGGERLRRIAVGNVVEGEIGRRQVHAGALAAPYARDRLHDFDEKARAVLGAAAVGVAAAVGLVAQKLIEQITVGGVHFDAVEARRLGVRGALPVLRDDAGNLRGLQRARRDVGLHAFERPRLTGRRDRGRRHRQCAAGLQRGMRDAPDMPELQKNPPARRMHRVGDELPAGDLLGAVDARRARIAEPLRRYLRASATISPAPARCA